MSTERKRRHWFENAPREPDTIGCPTDETLHMILGDARCSLKYEQLASLCDAHLKLKAEVELNKQRWAGECKLRELDQRALLDKTNTIVNLQAEVERTQKELDEYIRLDKQDAYRYRKALEDVIQLRKSPEPEYARYTLADEIARKALNHEH